MNTAHNLRLLSLAGLGSLFALSSFAQNDSYYYGGLSIGQSRSKIDEARISASLLAGGATSTAINSDESDTAFKLFGGYQINQNIAIEAGYFDLGKFGFTSTTVPAGTLNGQIKLRGLNLDLVGTLPLSERWSAIARVGAQFAQTRDTFSGTGAVSVLNPNPRKNDTNYKYGLGAQYAISPSMLLRGEVERYRVNDAVGSHGDVNLFSLSLVFPFGRTLAPRVAAAPAYVAPVYVAPMVVAPMAAAPAPVFVPAPAPVVVAPPAAIVVQAPPARRRVSYSADSFFNFDQSTMRSDGKSALDTFSKELQGTQFDLITVEGHADRLGSSNYNQKLSTERAESVKYYLVNSGGVDAAKITAIGKGESTTVTRPEDCIGSKATAQLIACLQPDRRVDIEVTGTRQ